MDDQAPSPSSAAGSGGKKGKGKGKGERVAIPDPKSSVRQHEGRGGIYRERERERGRERERVSEAGDSAAGDKKTDKKAGKKPVATLVLACAAHIVGVRVERMNFLAMGRSIERLREKVSEAGDSAAGNKKTDNKAGKNPVAALVFVCAAP